MEVWKDIPGFLGLYQASSLGRIKSLPRKVPHWRGGFSNRPSRIMKAFITSSGYKIVPLSKDLKERKLLVHRLIASTFIPNPKKKPCVNHLNGIKTDNVPSNLEWCTNSENINHADDTGLRCLKGENNSGSKLTEKQILEIRDIGKSKTLEEIGKIYGVRFQTIGKILNRKSWKHI